MSNEMREQMLGAADFRGVFPATPVPFDPDFSINVEELERVHRHILGAPGVTGVAVHGHVGEVLTLSPQERAEVTRRAVAVKNPGQLVVSGVEGRTVAEVAAQAVVAQEAGADALLVFPPVDTHPYRKLAQYPSIVTEFFERLTNETDLPLVAFQYADKSGCAYTNETLRALSRLDAVAAVKINTHSVVSFVEAAEVIGERSTSIVSVDSPDMLGMLMHDPDSLLIGVGSVMPELWSYLLSLVREGAGIEAATLHRGACVPLMDAIFQNHRARDHVSEASSIKEALRQADVITSARVRFPAQEVTEERRKQIAEALAMATKTFDEIKEARHEFSR